MSDFRKPAPPADAGASRGPSKIIPLEGSERSRLLAANRARIEAEEKAAKANRERLAGGSTSVGASRGRGAVTSWPWAMK